MKTSSLIQLIPTALRNSLKERLIPLTGILFFFLCQPAVMQAAETDPPYDEIPVYVNIPRVGSLVVPSLLVGQELYLPVTDIFSFLKINYAITDDLETISGFFIDLGAKYQISKASNSITYKGKTFALQQHDLIRTETNLYLKLVYFGSIFELDCIFNLRNVSVRLDTRLDLPLFRERRQELLHQNLIKLKEEVRPDTTIGRRFPLLKVNVADWAVTTVQNIGQRGASRFQLRLGGVVGGGEAQVSLNYDNTTPFRAGDQLYHWRYVNNDFKALRQVTAGKFSAQSTSTIIAPLLGVQFTNTPTTFRKSFGSYTISDHTEPDWMVELYVNNVLVDFIKADASGFYTFQVPLIFGNSMVRLRFFGPAGDEKTTEQYVSIPYTFLPQNIFEYTIKAGVIEDGTGNKFVRGQFNYGLTKKITIGGGTEFLSSMSRNKSMPFFTTTLRVTNNILFSGEHAVGVRSKSILSYRLPSDMQMEVQYTKYHKGQQAINTRFLEERKASFYRPWRTQKFSLVTRLTLNQTISPLANDSTILVTKYNQIPKRTNTTTDLLLSGTMAKFSANLTTHAAFTDAGSANMYSSLALTYRFPKTLNVRPQALFNYTRNRFVSMKVEVEKRVMGRVFTHLSYEKNFEAKINTINMGFRFDLSFARTAFSATRTNNNTAFAQTASGSILYDGTSNSLLANNRSSVGRGAITVVSFLDINCNGKREAGEPYVNGLRFRMNGGRKIVNYEDSSQRVVDLEPYRNYLLEIDINSFGNIAWQIKNKTISVAIDPNQLKLIEVPVAVMGEASGTVSLATQAGEQRLSRIRINFYDSTLRLVAFTFSESDGYFSYLGLSPGVYTCRVDTMQLRKLAMVGTPDSFKFIIAGSEEGVIADGFAFTLRSVLEPVALQSKKITTPRNSLDSAGQAYATASGLKKNISKQIPEKQPSTSQLPDSTRMPLVTGRTKEEIADVRTTGSHQPAKNLADKKMSRITNKELLQPSPLVKKNSGKTVLIPSLLQKIKSKQKKRSVNKQNTVIQKIRMLIDEQQMLIRDQKKLRGEIDSLRLERRLKQSRKK